MKYFRYNKTENMKPGSLEMFQFTHLITEARSKFSLNLKPYEATHDIIDVVEAFNQITFDYFTIPPIKIKTKPALYILRRRADYKDFMKDVKILDKQVHESDSEEFSESIRETTSAEEEISKHELIMKDQKILKKDSDENQIELNEEIDTKEIAIKEFKKIKAIESAEENKLDSLEDELKLTKTYSREMKPKITKPKFVEEIVFQKDKWKTLDLTNKKEDMKYKSKSVENKVDIKTTKLNFEGVKKQSIEESSGDFSQQKQPSVKENVKKLVHDLKTKEHEEKQTKKEKSKETSKLFSLKKEQKRAQVKDKLKNVLEKFKKNRAEQRALEVTKPKEAIKKIIEQEKTKEKEELNKLQQQIEEIIDNNPNIINKEAIKQKIQDAILNEIQQIEDSINAEKEAEDKSSKPTIRTKETIYGPDHAVVKKREKIIKLQKEISEEIVSSAASSESEEAEEGEILFTEDITLEPEIQASKENVTLEKGLEIYEEHPETSDSETEIEIVESEEDFDSDFAEATEKIDKIMSLIDEIVTNMEIAHYETEEIEEE